MVYLILLALARAVTAGNYTGPAFSEVVFHVLSLPHTAVEPRFSPCAYTQKVYRMCKMLKNLGLRSVLYANEGSSHDCGAFEQILTDEERQLYFGSDENWLEKKMLFDFSNVTGNNVFKSRTTDAIRRQVALHPTSQHVLLVSFGWAHYQPAINTGVPAIETGIGYNGSFASYRVYESHSWRNTVTEGTNSYHAVIPNCYFPEEFHGARTHINGRYLAFVGRLSIEKGIHIAIQILETMPEDYTLHVAGQGIFESLIPADHPMAPRIFYHGVLNATERNNMVVGAEALLSATTYREPFGGVMVEAQFLGTPVITMDHGAMVETVWHGVTGFRCQTFRCFAAAAREAHTLDRNRIIQRARETYDCNRVQLMYKDYFRDVLNLWGEGWQSTGDPGHLLDVKEHYPPSDPSSWSTEASMVEPDCDTVLSKASASPIIMQYRADQVSVGIARSEISKPPPGIHPIYEKLKIGLQMEVLLKVLKLEPTHRFVEAGCEGLALAEQVIVFLDEGHYTCVEPNAAQQAATGIERRPGLATIIGDRSPFLESSDHFDVEWCKGSCFDRLFSATMLTYATDLQQARVFLKNAAALMTANGYGVISLRSSPAVSFSFEEIRLIGKEEGFEVKLEPEIRELMMDKLPQEASEWIRIRRVKAAATASR
eukprot:gb/GEZN01003335.1/.p1 GENE.gb/GEZN01003335.1/~~gb/GEZN01003335.1/.p1  ORF type:complete len:680 (-),score=65.17 gb/GEZN01003335.1/:164-2128(-)